VPLRGLVALGLAAFGAALPFFPSPGFFASARALLGLPVPPGFVVLLYLIVPPFAALLLCVGLPPE
jgi:hypothetical protein